ncbi:integral membrane protein [Cordyceps javanica]|uniref:Integral membrane protein n=1 Tax=Cordyceps javanica TaxID=43265 RepID=A0A545V9C7_9HYPO|nr:integral membrane protein [Cordyceps javanica]TQW09548.1 integral membrane protein [Cordyceps javanica]
MLHQLLPTSGQDSGSYLQDSYHDHESRASDDSGLGTASDLSPAHNCFTSTVCAEDRETRAEPSKEYSGSHGECGNLPPSSADFPGHTLRAEIGHIVSHKLLKVLELGYKVVDRVILPFGFIALTTGIITFARFFEGHAIFGGLAHWIKGGVFFWLGLFNLGRWSGSFAELGWAWNLRPRRQSRQKGNFNLSAEFMESSLILVYGSTNIFLEHLGGWGGAWTAQDLEHMAITVLFIGGGLFGMLIESIHIRDLLNTTTSVSARSYSTEERGESNAPDTYQFSLNPIPALVILLLGIMMSSHHQATMTASMVHEQWGTLLLWASVARGLTYVLLYLRPPKSIFPSRPPTELLTSFGLIAGGIIFMASSSDTVNGMIHYSLDAMLLYTVTTGLVGILMAWEIAVLAIKGWAVRKELVLHG